MHNKGNKGKSKENNLKNHEVHCIYQAVERKNNQNIFSNHITSINQRKKAHKEFIQTLKTGASMSSTFIQRQLWSFIGPKSWALKTGERAASTNLWAAKISPFTSKLTSLPFPLSNSFPNCWPMLEGIIGILYILGPSVCDFTTPTLQLTLRQSSLR